jgi:hypothetical protein
MDRRFRLASLLAAVLLFAAGPACMIANCTLAAVKPSCPACHPTSSPPVDTPRPGADSLPCCVSVALPGATHLTSPADAGPFTPVPLDLVPVEADAAVVLLAGAARAPASEHAPPSAALHGPSGDRAPPLG